MTDAFSIVLAAYPAVEPAQEDFERLVRLVKKKVKSCISTTPFKPSRTARPAERVRHREQPSDTAHREERHE